jgi:hypothetical protein
MKLRELTHPAGETTVWPPQWIGSSGPSARSAVPEHGVLEGLERFGTRLLLQIKVNGLRRTATVQWDGPPGVGDVEVLLLASIGSQIRDIGNRELPARPGRTAPVA